MMINDLTVKDPVNILVKFADDMTVGAPVKNNHDSELVEVDNIEKWTETNRVSLNLDKTWEMVASGKSANPLPQPIAGIERKTWLKLLGIRPVLYVEFNPSHLIVEFFRRNFDGSDMFSLCVELISSDLIAGAVVAQI